MSRKLQASLLAIALFTAATLAGCSKPADSAAPAMFRGNLQHSGVYPTEGPSALNGVKWKFQTKDHIRSSPIIVGQTLYFGSDDQYVYAVDAATGKQQWLFKTEGAIKSTAAAVNNVLYVYSGDGKLYALDTGTGTLKWSFQTEGKDAERDRVDYWQSSPAVSDGVVYFGAGAGLFYAVNADSGKLKWKKQLAFNGYSYASLVPVLHASPAVDGDVVYVGLSGFDPDGQVEPGNVVALNAKNGNQIWISALLQAVDSALVLDDHAVYFGTRNAGLMALDKQTGKDLWNSQPLPYVLASPALYKGTLYSGSSDDHKLVALDAAAGVKKWSFTAVGPVHASPATDGKTVYIASGNHYSDDNLGVIYAVDALTGQKKWEYQTGGNIYSSPLLDNGVLFVGSDDGYLYAIN